MKPTTPVVITNKAKGDLGEAEVARLVKCPSCSKKLVIKTTSYPLIDADCTGCRFEAQIKSFNCKPTSKFRGSGWNIMNHALRSGQLIPSLIVNFKWKDKSDKKKQEIRFYPFLSKENLLPRIANVKSHNRKHAMFDYDLRNRHYYILYSR